MMSVTFHGPLSGSLREEATALTARVFPGVPELEGRYYYDSMPDIVQTGHVGDTLVALRPVVRRTLEVEGRAIAMAGGAIPALLAPWRGQGLARQMLDSLLERLRREGDLLSLAFVFDGAPAGFLTHRGYRRLEASFGYLDSVQGARCRELQPAYALDLSGGDLVESLQGCQIELGRGSF